MTRTSCCGGIAGGAFESQEREQVAEALTEETRAKLEQERARASAAVAQAGQVKITCVFCSDEFSNIDNHNQGIRIGLYFFGAVPIPGCT